MDWVYKQIIGFLANFFAEMGNMGAEMEDGDKEQVEHRHESLDEIHSGSFDVGPAG